MRKAISILLGFALLASLTAFAQPDHTVWCKGNNLQPFVIEGATGMKIIGSLKFSCKNGSGVLDHLDKMAVTVQLTVMPFGQSSYKPYGFPTVWECGAGTPNPSCPTHHDGIFDSASCRINNRFRIESEIVGWEDGVKSTYVPAPGAARLVDSCVPTGPDGVRVPE